MVGRDIFYSSRKYAKEFFRKCGLRTDRWFVCVCEWIQLIIMNYITTFKFLWLSLQLPLRLIVPLCLITCPRFTLVWPQQSPMLILCVLHPFPSLVSLCFISFHQGWRIIWGKIRGKVWFLFIWLINRPKSHVHEYMSVWAVGSRWWWVLGVLSKWFTCNKIYQFKLLQSILYI